MRDHATSALIDEKTIRVVSKADLLNQEREVELDGANELRPTHFISVKTGFGLDELLRRLEDVIKKKFDGSSSVAITRVRHRVALEECLSALKRSQSAALPELASEDLRLAARALGRITGRVDVEEILDIVFREFCIGK